MVTGPDGLKTKNGCADEAQQHITDLSTGWHTVLIDAEVTEILILTPDAFRLGWILGADELA
jgi:hypothetical protein